MNIRKAFITIGVSATLMLALPMSAFADCNAGSMHTEVIFDLNTQFSAEEQDLIRSHFISSHDAVQPYGLKCTLFGHDYKTEIVTTITHRVRSTSPRCLKEIFETKICTVCSDTVSTRLSNQLIICCD